MSDVADLIDRAAAKTGGNKSALARMLKIPVSHLMNWRAGTRTCTPEDRALLASVALDDPALELIRATLEKHAGTKKGELLEKVLGKLSRATGEVSSLSAVAAALSATYGADNLIRCIEVLSAKRPSRFVNGSKEQPVFHGAKMGNSLPLARPQTHHTERRRSHVHAAATRSGHDGQWDRRGPPQ